MNACPECYSEDNKATPILNKRECLENHTQYICGTCGRCICIETDGKRNLQRWNFPFRSLEVAKLYLRTADYTMKSACGIYEVISASGRKSYKIFPTDKEFVEYLDKSKKASSSATALLKMDYFRLFSDTKIKKLTVEEVNQYLDE